MNLIPVYTTALDEAMLSAPSAPIPPRSPRYIENLVVLRYPDTEYGQVIVMGSRR